MGFVIIDPKEIIRVQRVDIDLGSHSGQIRDIVQAIAGESTRR